MGIYLVRVKNYISKKHLSRENFQKHWRWKLVRNISIFYASSEINVPKILRFKHLHIHNYSIGFLNNKIVIAPFPFELSSLCLNFASYNYTF